MKWPRSDTYRDQIVIITGGASGIGLALGETLIARGARVTLADIDGAGARRAADRLGARASAAEVDVRDAATVKQLVDDTAERHGRLDLIFNNAGIAMAGEVSDMSLDDWGRILDVNLRGVVHGVAAAYPRMVAQGFGHIVNIASIAGLCPIPQLAAYSATKHAVVGLTLALRAEAARHGVKVTVVCPGFIDTPIKERTQFLNVDREAALAEMPFKFYPVDACAREILRGVAKNRRMIVVTRQARLLHGLNRLAPGFWGRLSGWTFERLRRRVEARGG